MNTLSRRMPKNIPMNTYKTGDRDERPWGYYVVTDAGIDAQGDEYCEKIITIKSGKILSLQSHALRRETWTVKQGLLTVLRDGKRLQISSRDPPVNIPLGSLHCMANLGKSDCVVEERQEGICREEDIHRYMDAYNRNTDNLTSQTSLENLAVYQEILADIQRNAQEARQHAA